MARSGFRLFVWLSLWLLLTGAAHAQPSSTPPPPEATIGPIKFGDITIDAALEMLERWSGRTVLHPAGLPAVSLSFSLNQKVTREEARQALETLLTLNGIAVNPLGDKYLKVIPINLVRSETPDFIEGSTLDLPPSGRIASKLFQLKFLRAGEFGPQISAFLNPAAASAPLDFDKANAMLITDTIATLQRIEMLIARLDQPSFEGLTPKFYKIHNSTASALVTKLQSLLSGNAATQLGSSTTYQADDRTNQIILLSDSRQQVLFDELISRLDTAGESSTRQEVIPLKHATASEVATLLSSLISGQNSVNARTGGVQSANQQLAAARTAALAAIAANNARQAAANAQANANRPGNTPAGPATPNVVVTNPALPGAQTEPSQQFSNILTVVADDRSNALVVSGTVDDLRLIKDIVTQLDVLLAQVRIEVVIAEITLTDSATSGIDSLGLVISGNKLVAFKGGGPGFSVAGAPDATTGAATSFATLTRTAAGVDLAATLNLGTTPRKANTNILSAPSIVTTHNKEANFFVGESRPVITSYQNTGNNTAGGAGYTSNVTYKDIGIRLTVKPLIGNDGSVQLDIKQEVNDLLDNVTIDGNSQPVIGSRTTESFISVNSGEIIVLGGLQRKAQSRSTTRLGGIPIIGDILGSRKRETTRTDLVFFVRPYVLTNTEADNAEAMARLQGNPMQKDIQSALAGAPAAKP